MQTKRRVAANP